MAGFLHDDIVCNILARLPTKSLLRVRCVSTHWNRMLKEPNFMKLRSRKIIILPLFDALHLIDDNVPTEDTRNFIVKRSYPIKNVVQRRINVLVIGTFNGIVVLSYLGALVLFNPFTRARKKLPCAPTHCDQAAYGFGYGANSDDLKIVRFKLYVKVCDVYNFKAGSWSSWSTSNYNINIASENRVGTFANGFLYWIASCSSNVLIVLDVKDMVLSELCPPFEIWYNLGTINGCLCAQQHYYNIFDTWVMKEQNKWSKIYSFNLPLSGSPRNSYSLRILDSGRILMVSAASLNIIIYDPSLDSYNTLDISVMYEDLWRMHVFEYVESLVSPLEMSSSRLESRQKDATKIKRTKLINTDL